jgi:hypothetical protein
MRESATGSFSPHHSHTNISIYILLLLLKLYEPTGVVVTEISLSAHPHAVYISLTLKYFEENLIMATSGRNM